MNGEPQKLLKDRDSGTMFYKDGYGWEDLRFPAIGLNPPGGVSDPDRDTDDGSLLFDKASTEVIAGMAQMPHSFELDSDIEPHIHWQSTDATAGNVLWRFSYNIASVNEEFAAAFTDMDVLVASSGVALKHCLSDFGHINMYGQTPSSIIKWTLARIGGDVTDTYDADVRLLEVDFHYRINSVGTGQEYTK